MMGQEVRDLLHVEGTIERLPGLQLLPVSTEIQDEKITRQVEFTFLDSKVSCQGYEIHMGRTVSVNNGDYTPLNSLMDGTKDGFYLNPKCFGTYIHGILDNAAFIDFLLKPYSEIVSDQPFDVKAYKEEQYNKLADHVRNHVNMALVYGIMTKE